MIAGIVEKWEANKDNLSALLMEEEAYIDYDMIYRLLVEHVFEFTGGCHIALFGNYYGDVVALFAEDKWDGTAGVYWSAVAYGSCSGCDTIERIAESDMSKEEKVADYMKLALHMVQETKKLVPELSTSTADRR